jgi:hypothetical protein
MGRMGSRDVSVCYLHVQPRMGRMDVYVLFMHSKS